MTKERKIMKLLILGANGFIGSNLIEHILKTKPGWHITGLDLATDKLGPLLDNPRVEFMQADMRERHDWIQEQVEEADVVLPLVAIAKPAT